MLTTALILTAALLTGGSDSPTPYTIDPTGITLPTGRSFDSTDVHDANIRTTTGHTINIHFEDGRSHALAGSTAVAWTQLGLQPGDCIAWVQLHGFNEHFGEGGQDPICLPTPDTTEPEPELEPEPEPELSTPPYDCPLTDDGTPIPPRGCDWPIEICNWDNCTGVEPPLELHNPNHDTQDITITPNPTDTNQPTAQPTSHTPDTTATDAAELAHTGTTTTTTLTALALILAGTITHTLTQRTKDTP